MTSEQVIGADGIAGVPLAAPRRRVLPLTWLMSFMLCLVLVIVVPAVSFLQTEVKQGAVLAEQAHDRVLENQVAARALAEQMVPAFDLEIAAREYFFEIKLAILDPDRDPAALAKAADALRDAALALQTSWVMLPAEHSTQIDESVGILLDIADESAQTSGPRYLQQLLYDSRDSLVALAATIDRTHEEIFKQHELVMGELRGRTDDVLSEVVRQRNHASDLRTQARLILGLLVMIFVAAGVGVYWVISRRLRDVGRYSRALASGRHDVSLDWDCDDAIGQVARDVQSMGGDLARQVVELERQAKFAQQASRAKSEFLANMSHEIRTPINGVLGMTEVLMKTRLDDKQRRFATTVRRCAENLLWIINDILDFSKIEAGKLELQEGVFNLRDLIEDIGELFVESAHSKGLELICSIPPPSAISLRGDAGRLRQVLTNLVANAIKFTDQGEVVVRIAAQEEAGDDVLIRFEVRDSGIGIAADAQTRIFASFEQVDGSTDRKYGGTGLGLSISAQLAALMGGEIGVDSAVGEGSVFWFTARFKLEADNETACTTGNALAGLRVLIVDDNETNREILQHQLSSWRVETACASSGPEALDALRRAAYEGRPYQLAILDMHMPEMDGIVLSHAISADARINALPRVMLSSICDHIDAQEYQAANITAHLTKPVRQSDLYNCLTAVIAGTASNIAAGGDDAGDSAAAQVISGGRILLAEDNRVNQEVTLELLEPMGVSTSVAQNGHEAVDAWFAGSYDLILMDCQMPDMDGYQATAQIRHLEEVHQKPRTPIIALTANARQGDREQCLDAGMDDYLSKPFSEWQLHEKLRRWLPARCQQRSNTLAVTDHTQLDVTAPCADEKLASMVLDHRVLDKFYERERNGRKNVAQRIIGAYLKQAPTQIEQLCAAVGDGDLAAVRSAAHALKSSSANVGAMGLSAMCEELEALARDSLERKTITREQTAVDFGTRFSAVKVMSNKVRDALSAQCKGQAA